MNQKVILRSLNTLGFKDVKVAIDGKQAFDALSKELPDLIFMDVQMYVQLLKIVFKLIYLIIILGQFMMVLHARK